MRVETIREPGFALLPRLEQRSLTVKFTGNGDMNWTGYSTPELDGMLVEAARQQDDNDKGWRSSVERSRGQGFWGESEGERCH